MERPHLGLAENAETVGDTGRVQAATSGRNSMSKKIVVYSQPG
jgi:hypothetical protein